MQATITWRPASEPPARPLRVLLATKNEKLSRVPPGVEEGSRINGEWFDSRGQLIERFGIVVTHWAEMPAHPEQK